MKNIMIILNAVVYNRGSEALVRGISSICKKDECIITLVSSEKNFGKDTVNIESIDVYQKKESYNGKSVKWFFSKLFGKIGLKGIAYSIRYKDLYKAAKKQDIIIIVGADNYDITYNLQGSLNILNTQLRKRTNAKIILYDCSIDKRDITDTLKKDFANFDYVTVRESITKENVEKIIDRSKMFYFPDPAFVMKPQQIELNEIFEKRKVVGINVSNLITKEEYGSQKEKIINAYHKLIKYILENTDMGIVLVPHVMNNADLSALKILYKEYEDDERVILIDDESLNARQLKYLISKCELYVGARTHSTIAAYSSCVPTLVLGYSVKSKGIAKDLFGTDEKYVLPVATLDNDEYLVNGFKWLLENKVEIKERLNKIMPDYIKKAESTYELIKKCEEGD